MPCCGDHHATLRWPCPPKGDGPPGLARAPPRHLQVALSCNLLLRILPPSMDTLSASPDCDIVGRWGESLDNFSEDEENIVPITEDDDIHLLDVDDVEAVMADASEENGLDVEDDVWNAAVARLGSENTQPVWGYVGPQTEQQVPIYTAYEPPTSMYDVDYTAMRDREHEARVFGSSSSSNYGELVLNSQFETKKEAQLAVKEYCIKHI
ncbi:hypothetical protein V6N11_070216 [Hibiscus sabdariffa]|uniref:Uncharacterized protein n=1 Tax=Hibiscus sabdariffa TaxID=183260 RepID=A0ABR2QED5_9ROSI